MVKNLKQLREQLQEDLITIMEVGTTITPELVDSACQRVLERCANTPETPRTIRVPKSHPVQPLKAGQKAKLKVTCGVCGLSWDDGKVTSMTPAPAARCPFEAFHVQ